MRPSTATGPREIEAERGFAEPADGVRASERGAPRSDASTGRPPGILNRRALPQPGDRLPVVAELEQDLLGVLAELGRGRARRPARAGEVDRATRPCRRVPPSATGTSTNAPAAIACGSATTSVGRLHRRPPHAGAVEDARPTRRAGAWRRSRRATRDQLGAVLAAGAHGREARVVEPLGALDGAHQVGPVAIALEAEEPEPAAVAGAVAADQRVRRRRCASSASPGCRGGASCSVSQPSTKTPMRRSDVETSCPRPVRSRASSAAAMPPAAVMPAMWSPMRAALVRRVAARRRQRRGDAGARPEGADVVRRPIAVRAGVAVAGDAARRRGAGCARASVA